MRRLLLPFSWLYGLGVFLRNKLYDWHWKKRVEFDLPVIGIGNLSMGGTGKTPHAEYLLRLMDSKYHCGVLSRGYGRKTKGYRSVDAADSASQAGDEPLQMKRKFPAVTVAVCEQRVIGIPWMMAARPELQVIILDDAFQHLPVKPGFNILLTDHARLFTDDCLLPAGNLREGAGGAKRADVIVVTKCPENISAGEKKTIAAALRRGGSQPVFFSSVHYGQPYRLLSPGGSVQWSHQESVLLVTGIAQAEPLKQFVASKVKHLIHLRFADHHRFSSGDLQAIEKKFSAIKAERKRIITTEKDGMRFLDHRDFLLSHQLEITCLPVEVDFSQEEKPEFDAMLLRFVNEKLKQENHE